MGCWKDCPFRHKRPMPRAAGVTGAKHTNTSSKRQAARAERARQGNDELRSGKMTDLKAFPTLRGLVSLRVGFAIGLSVMLAAPASATCLLTEQPIQNASATLIRQDSTRPIIRLTDGNGLLSLSDLRRGRWQATFKDGGEAFPFQIARARRASLIAVEQTTRCSAPPNPNGPPPQPPTTQRVIRIAE